MKVNISLSISKEVDVDPIYDEDGDLDLYESIENVAIPSDLAAYVIYENGKAYIDSHILSDLSNWNLDDIAVYEN